MGNVATTVSSSRIAAPNCDWSNSRVKCSRLPMPGWSATSPTNSTCPLPSPANRRCNCPSSVVNPAVPRRFSKSGRNWPRKAANSSVRIAASAVPRKLADPDPNLHLQPVVVVVLADRCALVAHDIDFDSLVFGLAEGEDHGGAAPSWAKTCEPEGIGRGLLAMCGCAVISICSRRQSGDAAQLKSK